MPQRLMTPEALEFVRLTSVQTVKGWEDRAQLQEFRRALQVTVHRRMMNTTNVDDRWIDQVQQIPSASWIM